MLLLFPLLLFLEEPRLLLECRLPRGVFDCCACLFPFSDSSFSSSSSWFEGDFLFLGVSSSFRLLCRSPVLPSSPLGSFPPSTRFAEESKSISKVGTRYCYVRMWSALLRNLFAASTFNLMLGCSAVTISANQFYIQCKKHTRNLLVEVLNFLEV